VLANVEGRQLGSARLELLRAFVAERGGGLLVLGAQSFLNQGLLGTSIEEALPLDLAGRNTAVLPATAVTGLNRVALTTHGAAHPVMQLGVDADDTGAVGRDAAAVGDRAAGRASAWRLGARGDRRPRRRAAGTRGRPALRRRALDGVHR
jgi:hypothetical protein